MLLKIIIGFVFLSSQLCWRFSPHLISWDPCWLRCMLPYFSSKSFNHILCCCSVTQCPTLCDPMGCSTPGFPVLHHLLELAQTHVHRVGDAIQPSHTLLSLFPPAFNLSQHQGLFWVSSLHWVAKVLKFQHQFFQWIFRRFPLGLTSLISLHSKGPFKSLLQHHSWKVSVLRSSASLWSNSHIHTWLQEKP